jgi:adhesin transport system membrane fusion protein
MDVGLITPSTSRVTRAADPGGGPRRPSPSGLELALSHFDQHIGGGRRLRRPRSLLYVALAMVVALMVWMTFASVDRVVRTQGRVIPSGKPQLVQHLEGGIVSRVYVKEGDIVQKGQLLISVSDLLANSSRGEKEARLNGLLARAARQQAEAEGSARFVVPAELNPGSPEVRNESEAFDARQFRLKQTTRVLEEQARQKRQELAEQEARAKGLNEEISVARQQLAVVSGMHSKGAASQLELLEAKARVERLVTQIREAESSKPRLAAAEAELVARLSETVAQFRSDARTGLSDTRVELQRLQQELNAERDRVLRTDVVAPVSGTVNKLLANTVGGVVKPGETLLELTPSDGAVVVEARVSPAERGALRVGQKAIVRVAAFDYTVYGTIAAEVTEISADSLVDERGERYFRVGMLVDEESYRAFGQPLSPGMTLTADAVTGQRTILAYVLSPVRGIASTAFRDSK